MRYQILNSGRARLISAGPDRKPGTRWDIGLMIDLPQPAGSGRPSWTDRLHPAEPWLVRRKRELGIQAEAAGGNRRRGIHAHRVLPAARRGLHGAAYFWFFTWLMLGTAVAFVPYALLYRPKTYLQD